MKIKTDNGYLIYSIEESEITIDQIFVNVPRLGTGTQLISKLKAIAAEKRLPIGLYSAPLNDTISDESLLNFYFSNGFVLDSDDIDGHLLIFR